MSKHTFRGGFLAAVLACLLAGCGSDAPDTYRLSGTVTFDGKPVPAGQIYFMPDAGKDNNGPSGFAQIHDGKFDTSAEGGKGHVSGPMLVRIEGFDPASKSTSESGEEVVKSLFPTYQTTADLPKNDSTQDFAVPKEAADRVDQPETNRTPGGV